MRATIDSSVVGGGWVWNCSTIDVTYTYEFDGRTFSAVDNNPFLNDTSAKLDPERFKAGETAVVRVNPLEPQKVGAEAADQRLFRMGHTAVVAHMIQNAGSL